MELPYSPAAERNREPIYQVLSGYWPPSGRVLEVASGTGQHVVYFAARQPQLQFLPTEASAADCARLALRLTAEGSPNIAAPQVLEVTQTPWAVPSVAMVLAFNLIHIAPWEVALSLFQGAGERLDLDGYLVTYGPYRFGEQPLAPSNQAFDDDLKARNPAWGLRRVELLESVARAHGLVLAATYPMPANNHTLVFRRV